MLLKCQPCTQSAESISLRLIFLYNFYNNLGLLADLGLQYFGALVTDPTHALKSLTCLQTVENDIELLIMPRLHLPLSSYDLFVYDFPYDFFGIVGGYKLRHMCLHCLRSPYDFFRRQTRTKPYRDLADIVRQSQGNRTIIV